MSSTTILIVDDDPHMLELLSLHIESAGFDIFKAENGLTALQLIDKHQSVLSAIVSDVEMPELDGYGLCQQVREIDAIKELPFIFVSAKNSLEEKIKGFEVGGDDYITKPVEGEEVVVKVRHIIDNKIRHLDLSRQLDETRNAAVQAMSYSSNLGQVLQFMKATTEINSFEQLAEKLFESASGLGLIVVLQLHTPGGIVNYKQGGEVTPLEANVIELSRSKGRIFDFQNRTIFNYNEFSLLILNMPVEDKEKYGLLKDVLSSLCDAVESRAKLLSSDQEVKQKSDVINSVTGLLQNIDQAYRDVQQANLAAIDDMTQRIEEAMFGFGLSEGQEDAVRGIVMMAKKKTAEVFEDGKELYDDFERIRNVLENGLK